MNNYKDIFLKSLNNIEILKTMDIKIKREIIEKYDVLAQAYYNANSVRDEYKAKAIVCAQEIKNNQVIFDYISNPLIYTVYTSEKISYGDILAKSAELSKMLSSKNNFDIVTSHLTEPTENFDANALATIFDTYNLDETAEGDDIEDIISELDNIDDIPYDSISDLDNIDILKEIEVEEIDTEQEIEEDKSTKDLAEMIKQVYDPGDDPTAPLSIAADGIIKSYKDLYESCYSGIYYPDGVLTSKGLISYDKTPDGTRKIFTNHAEETDSTKAKVGKIKYDKPYKAIMYAVGVSQFGAERPSLSHSKEEREFLVNQAIKLGEDNIGSLIDRRKDTTPKLADACIKPYMYPRFHLEMMTGYFGLNNKMREWAIENKAKRSKEKITSFEDVMKWARKRVVDCLVQACIDSGITEESIGVNDSEIVSILQTMSKSLKSIIVITNMKKSYFTLKICTHVKLDAKRLTNEICHYYNMSSNGSVSVSAKIKNDGAESNVIDLDIILNEIDYNKASSFSAEVIDNIIQSGQVPSWSNAIMGEKNNGGTLTFNFKESCSVAIYGASGSGKGIMTSALLTNAIAEGCEVFYFDGKPDNGAALAKIAWDSGAGDVAVFNGCTGGSDTFQDFLENYSHGIRDVALRDRTTNAIPLLEDNEKWPFKNENMQKQLAEVSFTLQAFQFVHDMVLLRCKNENVEMLGNGQKRWAVFVIDEIQDAATKEKNIREAMKTYMEIVGEQEVYVTESKETRNGIVQQQKKSGKIKDEKNWSKDTGYLFCKQWLDWANSLCINWDEVVTKALRNSSSTLITIFQSNQWLNQTENGAGKTKIGKLMLKVSQKTTKIVGKGSLVASNQWGDDTSYAWDNDIAIGKWALANGESGLSDNAIIFKPFKVFTTDLGANVMVPTDDYGAGANNCWIDASHNGKMPMGLQSYIKYMFSGLQEEIASQVDQGIRLPSTVTPEGVLVSSLEYFNNLTLKTQGKTIYEYLYNIDKIINFDGTISETEANRISENTEKEENIADAYNAMLDSENNMDDEDDTLDDLLNNKGKTQNHVDNAKTETPKVKLPNIVGYNKFIELDTIIQNKIINKVKNETLNVKFNTYNRDKNAMYGLTHLCYNLSILYGINLASLDRINNGMKTFATNYLTRLNQGVYEFDYVPNSADEINELNTSLNAQYNTPQNNDNDIPIFEEITNEYKEPDFDPSILFEDAENALGDYDDNHNNYGEQANVRYEHSQQASFEKDKTGRTIWVNPMANAPGMNIIGLGADNFIDSTPINQTGGFWSMLSKTQRGQDEMFSKRNDFLISLILNKMKNANSVTRLRIEEQSLTVNGLLVNTDVVIDDERGIRLIDVIDIRKMLKTFKNVSTLTIDAPMFQQLLIQTGDSDDDVQNIWNIFKSNPNLQVLNIQMSPGAQFDTITRRDFRQNTGKIGKAASEMKFRIGTDFIANMHNNRLKDKGIGERNAALKIAGNFGNNAKQKLMDKNPNIWKGAGYGALALVAGTVGVGFSLGSSLVNLFRRH